MKLIQRLKTRKGFTIIELVVVIAIIGVLIAMIVPTLSYDNKPAIAKAAAKDFFYTTQDSLATLKISSPEALKSYGSGVTFYAVTDGYGNVSACGVATGGKKTFDSLSGSATGDAAKMYKKLKTDFEAYLTTTSDLNGVYYVTVDDEFRVKSAYWTDTPVDKPFANDSELEDDNTLNGYYCLAFPVDNCRAGAKLEIVD